MTTENSPFRQFWHITQADSIHKYWSQSAPHHGEQYFWTPRQSNAKKFYSLDEVEQELVLMREALKSDFDILLIQGVEFRDNEFTQQFDNG